MQFTKIYTKTDKEKSRLISDISGKGFSLLVFFDQSPKEFIKKEMEQGKIKIEELRTGGFLVYAPYTYKILNKWLCYGNWQAIYPPKVDFQGLNTFKAKEEEIKNHMLTNQIEIYIDSFHDDIEWNVLTLQQAK